MRYINYGLYYIIQLVVLYAFFLLYTIAINGQLFGQICYITMFVLYYFCRDINVELLIGNVKQHPQKLVTQIYTGVINLVINWILVSFIVKGYIAIVMLYLVINFVGKISADLSLAEIIGGYRIGIEEENAHQI